MGHCNIPLKPPYGDEVLRYIADWKRNMTAMLDTRLRPSDGLFSPACFIHTEFGNTRPYIVDEDGRSLTFTRAFAQWYSGDRVRLRDDCEPLVCGHCGNFSEGDPSSPTPTPLSSTVLAV